MECVDLGLKLIESMSAMMPLLISSIAPKSIRICFCFGMYCLEIEKTKCVNLQCLLYTPCTENITDGWT